MAWFKRRPTETTYSRSGGDATLTAYVADGAREVEIPARVKGRVVTAIGPHAFAGAAGVERVVIPDSVLDVGHHAFADCRDLKEVIVGSGVAELHSSAFEGASRLESVLLPDGLKEIYRDVFKGCESLTSLEIPESVEVLNQGVFEGCNALASVGLPYELRRVGSRTFKGCSSLADLYYYSKRGVSSVMITDRELREDTLPMMLEYIGRSAFEGCESLARVTVPYLVRELPKAAFKGCASLERVEMHNVVHTIGDEAFANCPSLSEIAVPLLCREIGKKAFDEATTIVSSKRAPAAAYARTNGYRHEVLPTITGVLDSAMVPGTPERFYSDEGLRQAVRRYELRHPAYDLVDRAPEPVTEVEPPRFSRTEGGYSNGSTDGRASIMMVGDVMATHRQQAAAANGEGEFDFSFSFEHVSELLSRSDLAIANLESMISPSAPYTLEREHVNARPHLNSSPSLLAAMRNAGFDCVVNAQNHVYDTGTQGIFETVDQMNRHGLMHTGAFGGPADKRYVRIDVGGISVGVVSYMDGARQRMKKANFTKTGRDHMLSPLEEVQVRRDIQAARADGAEFIIAYCHWGREYTTTITDRQSGFAKIVADAGADFIFGSHSHCIQPYVVLDTRDGRQVPCLYSSGNFLSSINVKPPIARDSLVFELRLARSEDGRVRIDSETAHPCRILNLEEGGERNFAVVPTDDRSGGFAQDMLLEAEHRILGTLGDSLQRA